MSLSAKVCVPCQGGVDPMDLSQAEEMIRQVPGWKLDD